MKLTPFAVEISLPGQGRMAVGGLCDSAARRTVQALCRALTPPCLPGQDPLGIDRALAALLDTFPSEGIYAAGASAAIPARQTADFWRSGGVIGLPGSSHQDAGGALEELENGLYLYAAPGGPGFAVSAPWSHAQRLAELAGRQPGRELLPALRALAPEGYLLICDGTGMGAQGLLAAGAGEEELLLPLDQSLLPPE